MATLDHDERPAIELHRALKTMSPDTGTAARCIILTATGHLVGAVALSAADVDRLRLAATTNPGDDFDDLDTSDAALVLAEAEAVIVAAELGGREAGRPRATRSGRTPRRWKIWRRR